MNRDIRGSGERYFWKIVKGKGNLKVKMKRKREIKKVEIKYWEIKRYEFIGILRRCGFEWL